MVGAPCSFPFGEVSLAKNTSIRGHSEARYYIFGFGFTFVSLCMAHAFQKAGTLAFVLHLCPGQRRHGNFGHLLVLGRSMPHILGINFCSRGLCQLGFSPARLPTFWRDIARCPEGATGFRLELTGAQTGSQPRLSA